MAAKMTPKKSLSYLIVPESNIVFKGAHDCLDVNKMICVIWTTKSLEFLLAWDCLDLPYFLFGFGRVKFPKKYMHY